MSNIELAWAVAGCLIGAAAQAQETPGPIVVSGAASGAVYLLDVETAHPGPVSVTYGPSSGASYMLSDSVPARSHTLVLARLMPDTDHHYAVASGGDTVRGTFRAPALPPAVRQLGAQATGRPTHPLTLLETGQKDGFNGLVVVDGTGRVVWYCETGGIAHGAVRRHTGSWVVVDPTYGLRELSPACEQRSGLPRSPGRIIHHDVTEAPDGSLLYLAREQRTVEGRTLTGEFIRRWVPETGADEEVWSSFDHLDPDVDWSARSRPGNWLHANSLSIGPRGNLVVSLAHLDQVLSIHADGRATEWRLGGVGASHPIAEGRPFSGQHTADEVAPGRVLLFDNGLASGSRTGSRAVEYDLRDGSAHEVWSFKPEPANWSRVVGSALRMGSGHTLVTFGASAGRNGSTGPMEVFEVTPEGSVVWHLVVTGPYEMVYRATPLWTIGGETAARRLK